MSVLYWGRNAEQFGACYARFASESLAIPLEYQATPGELCQSLLARSPEGCVVVLAPPSDDDLRAVSTLRPMLLGVPVVVVLASSEPESLALAHHLRPRFVGTACFPLADMALIVRNLACDQQWTQAYASSSERRSGKDARSAPNPGMKHRRTGGSKMSNTEPGMKADLADGLEGLEGLYLTFALAEEVYGLEILAVQEIIQLVPTTAIPKTPSYVRGVVNLRGKVIPVVDLRAKFGMDPVEDTGQTCIIVVQVAGAGRATTMGVVVDRVAEVIEVAASQIEPPPSFGAAVDTDFLVGMGKVGDTVVMLLDIRRVLAAEELASAIALAEA